MEPYTSDVFGLRTTVSEYSYIDRGNLDKTIAKLATRNHHIALKGESKSGKSWLRQRAFPNAIVIQCRIDHTVSKIYTDILRSLGIARVPTGELGKQEVSFGAKIDAGRDLLKIASAQMGLEYSSTKETTYSMIGGGADDLPFIAELIKLSGRKVVVEDFHYLDEKCRSALAQDLKALWDFKVYFVIVGIWRNKNYLTYLNPDLAGRIVEVPLHWTDDDLAASLNKGAEALNCRVPHKTAASIIKDSYGNIGLLQSLALALFDEFEIEHRQPINRVLHGEQQVIDSGMAYAEQLEAVYTNFSERVSAGIRNRQNSTKIYENLRTCNVDDI